MKEKAFFKNKKLEIILAIILLFMLFGMTKVYATENIPTYTISIPATITVGNSGWNEFSGGIRATGSNFRETQTLSVTANSEHNWSLVSEHSTDTIGYNLVSSNTSTYSSSATPATWEFSKSELEATNGTTKTAGIVVEDYSNKKPGNYENTVTFTVSVISTSYTVTFKDGETTLSTQTVDDGETATRPTNPTKDGFDFVNWYSDSELTTVYDFTSAITGDTTLYAKWEVESPRTKYAVQIYGINQDEDSSGNTLGLTFGPAVGANYNNAYVTHEYEETSEGSGEYYVKIVTHTVAANGSETTSSAYLTDSDSKNVTRSQDQVDARENISLHDMTWAEIAAVEDKTVFTDCMLCGDTKSVKLSLNSTIGSGSVFDQYGDGAGMLYDTVKSTTDAYYRTWNPRYIQNAYVGTGVTLDKDEYDYGSNARNAGGYSVSHIRATLIGKNEKTNEGYAGNVNLTNETCLYSCIESDLQAVITPKKIKYVTGTSTSDSHLNADIADSIWLFSDREMYGTGQYSGNTTEGLGASGDGYNKFGNTQSKYYISSYNANNNTNRVAYAEDGSTVYWWLRSPSLGSTCNARRVGSGGNIDDGTYSDRGLAFGFCIQ